jgi:catechol 2,3-dioxygenase-like lactoylglutathione lyase family enzyme
VDLNHLHLHVRDLGRSRRFYETWLGFREHAWYEDLLFLRNAHGFDLALMPDPAPAPLPDWFHFGFRLESAAAVRELHERMRAAGVPFRRALHEEPELVSFRCEDPDGCAVEVYWE